MAPAGYTPLGWLNCHIEDVVLSPCHSISEVRVTAYGSFEAGVAGNVYMRVAGSVTEQTELFPITGGCQSFPSGGWLIQPPPGGWTPAAVNGLQVRFRRQGATLPAGRDLWIDRVRVEVTHSATAAAGPSNDTCAGATSLGSSSGVFAFDNTCAGQETAVRWQDPYFDELAGVDHDVWFSWVAPCNSLVRITTAGLTEVDTVIGVYHVCSNGYAIAGNNDLPDLDVPQSYVEFAAVAGQTYLIQIGSSPDEPGGIGQFTLSTTCRPPHDACAFPQPIDYGTPHHAFDTTLATTGVEGQSNVGCDEGFGPGIHGDLWYTFTAWCTGRATISTDSALDTRLAVYGAGGCPGAYITCSDNISDYDGNSRVTFDCVAGTQYRIQLGVAPDTAQGIGQLLFSCEPRPINDDCSSAIIIPAGSTTVSFDSELATTSLIGQNNPGCDSEFGRGIHRDLWYRFRAPCTGDVTISTEGLTDVDTKFAVYLGQSCPGPYIACEDDVYGTYQTSVTFRATAGTWYTIQLGSSPGQPGGTGAFSISCRPPCQADFDGDEQATVPDLFAFLSAWFAGDLAADADHSGVIGVPDIFAFLSIWFVGCP